MNCCNEAMHRLHQWCSVPELVLCNKQMFTGELDIMDDVFAHVLQHGNA